MRWYCVIAAGIAALGFGLAAGPPPAGTDTTPAEINDQSVGAGVSGDSGRNCPRPWHDIGLKSDPLSIARLSLPSSRPAARCLRFGPVWRSAVPVSEARWCAWLPGCDENSSLPSAATLQSQSIRLQI